MPLIKIHNAETNEIIEREMNDQELAQWHKDNALEEERLEKEAAIIQSRAALLKKLGITEDEAKLLLS